MRAPLPDISITPALPQLIPTSHSEVICPTLSQPDSYLNLRPHKNSVQPSSWGLSLPGKLQVLTSVPGAWGVSMTIRGKAGAPLRAILPLVLGGLRGRGSHIPRALIHQGSFPPAFSLCSGSGQPGEPGVALHQGEAGGGGCIHLPDVDTDPTPGRGEYPHT